MTIRAVVFAYHNVGVRCLQVLLAHHVDVALVVTHHDNPEETIWFASVAAFCAQHGIACIAPDSAAAIGLFEQVQKAKPDVLFSFYYRHMLPPALLELAPSGAFNMHGSLLPKYRGRAPVNWAVLHGETVTGATLHVMAAKPDAGDIVAQSTVSILPDDTAHNVFGKVVGAAQQALEEFLPLMLKRQTPRRVNDLSKGSYFGGRTAADGLIDWTQPAQVVYNLVRAVAPPYPGAWTLLAGQRLIVAKARLLDEAFSNQAVGLKVVNGKILGICGDGGALNVQALHYAGAPLSAEVLRTMLGQIQSTP